MRVAYVTTDPGIPAFGTKGASIHVQAILGALIRQGADVTLFAPEPGTPLKGLEGVRVHPLPQLKKATAEARAQALLAQNGAIGELLSQAEPFDLVYERHALFSFGAMEFARAHGIPSVLEVNAPLMDEQQRHRDLPLADRAALATRRAMGAARRVVCVSDGVAAYARAHGATDAVVIPNGVDPARFSTRAKFDGDFTVGFLGTLKPWHDAACLIDAVARLRARVPNARLLIVGDGPERARCEAQAEALGLRDAVSFTGAVAPSEVPGHLARMHVGVAPYRGGEPFYFSPLKLYEYMAAGLPVIVSDVGNLAAFVAETGAGRSVHPDDPQALAEALSALAADPAAAARAGAAGRSYILAHQSWDSVLDRILAGLPPRLQRAG